MKMKWNKLKVIFLLYSVFQTLDGSGKFEVKLMKYINPGGKGSNGNCCETPISFWCSGNCDHRFTICVDENKGSDQISHCPLGKIHTGEVSDQNDIYNFPSNIGGTPNPMVFNVDRMPTLVRLKFEVVDVDDHNTWDHVDNLIHVITYMNVARSAKDAHFAKYEFSARTSLTIGFRSYCDENFFTKTCSVYCRTPQSGDHYICNKHTGQKFCLLGWKGPECDQDIDECLKNPCKNGTCDNFNGGFECTCKEGFGGKLCSDITSKCAHDPCKNNGTCQSDNLSDFNCTCAEGWVGERCEEKFTKCYHSPCENGGRCTLDQSIEGYHCQCDRSRFDGPTCGLELVDFTGPPMTIVLYGTITEDNTPLQKQLEVGLKNILLHLAGYVDFISIKQDIEAKENEHKVNVTIVKFIAATNGGWKVIPLSDIEKTFNNNPDEELNQYLPLPLYNGEGYQQPQIDPAEKVTNWADQHWYIFFLILLALIVVVIVGTLFYIRRRRQKADTNFKANMNGVSMPNGGVNVAFENDMYLRMNSANSRTEGAMTHVSDNPVFEAPPLPPATPVDQRPHEVLVAGITATDSTTENPYMEPTHHVEYDTPPRSQFAPLRSHYENSCLDTREAAGSDVKDNFYTDFGNLDGRAEENHYQDLDDVAMEKLNPDKHEAPARD